MDNLEAAVMLCLDPSAQPDLKAKALQFCQSVTAAHDGWKYAIQQLSISMRPEVAFWCLQVLHDVISNPDRYPGSIPAGETAVLRNAVMQYCAALLHNQCAAPNLQNGTSVNPTVQPPSFLLNKLSQVIVALIGADYPLTWPDAFQGFVLALAANRTAASDHSLRMFFRLLRSLDNDVTSVRATQQSGRTRLISTRVKDAMRNDCIAAIVTICAQLLQRPAFAPHALDIVSRYVEWIDIKLVLSEDILNPIYTAIISENPCTVRAPAAAALGAIVAKRMNPSMKIDLLNHLNVITLLPSIPTSQHWSDEEEGLDNDLSFQNGRIETARLVNTIAMACLDVMKATMKTKEGLSVSNVDKTEMGTSGATLADAGKIAEVALPVGIRFLGGNVDEATSSQMLQCITNYVNMFARSRWKNNEQREDGSATISAILHVLAERARFPPEYDPFEKDDVTENPFSDLRHVLINSVFRGIVRALPETVLSFIEHLAQSSTKNTEVAGTELVLTLLTVILESAPGSPRLDATLTSVMRNPPSAMSSSLEDIGRTRGTPDTFQAHQLEALSIAFFDLVSRSYKILLLSPSTGLLSDVLPVFFDGRGLCHQWSATIRSQAAYYLLKLVRPLRSAIAKAYLDVIVNAMQPRMFPILDDITAQPSQDQMVLFEIVGCLLGCDQKHDRCKEYLPALLNPVITGLRSGNVATAVAHISAAGQLSKGFGGDSKSFLLSGGQERENQTHKAFMSPRKHKDKSANGEIVGKMPNGPEIKTVRMTELAPDLKLLWVDCLKAVLNACSPLLDKPSDLSGDVELRAKLIFFLHRMVDTMGKDVLPFLASVLPDLLRTSKSASDLCDVISLVSQSVTKFTGAFAEVASAVFSPIVKRVQEFSFDIDPRTLMAMSEEGRERVEVNRAYHYLLDAIVGSELISILIAPAHVSVLPSVVESVVASIVGDCLDIRSVHIVMKLAFNILRHMVEQWVSNAGSGPPGFAAFVVNRVAPSCVLSGCRGTAFRAGDYGTGPALTLLLENISLQRLCARRVGIDFGESMRSRALSTLPADQVNNYLNVLYSEAPAQETAKIFVSILGALRAQDSGGLAQS